MGGPIETVTITTEYVIIRNEEGLLHRLPFNVEVCGLPLLGTVLVAGVDGEEFASIKARHIPPILKLLGGR